MIRQVVSCLAGASCALVGYGGYWGLQADPPDIEAVLTNYPLSNCGTPEYQPPGGCDWSGYPEALKAVGMCSDDTKVWWPARQMSEGGFMCTDKDKPSRFRVLWHKFNTK